MGLLLVIGLAAQLFVLMQVQDQRLQQALGVVMAAHLGVAWLTLRSQTTPHPEDKGAGLAGTLQGIAQTLQDTQQELEHSGWTSAQPGPAASRRRSAASWQLDTLVGLPGLESAAALRRLQGDESAYVRSLQHFVQRYSGGIGHWVAWVDNSRWEDLERAAHQLQLHAGAVGARNLQAASLRLEMQVASEDALGAHACLPALQEDLSLLLAALAARASPQGHDHKTAQGSGYGPLLGT